MKQMRPVVPALLLACSFLAVSASAQFKDITPAQNSDAARQEFTFAVLPAHGALETTERFAPLAEYLSRRLGVKIRLLSLSSFDDHVERVRAGKVDFALQNPLVFASCMDNAQALATVMQDGKDSVAGQIVVRADSALKSLEDLRGKTVAIPSRLSAAGFLSQLLLCRAEGLDPGRDFSVYIAAGNKHENVLLDVHEKRADAGFCRPGTIEAVAKRIPPEDFRVLAEGEPTPGWVFSAGLHVPDPVVRKMKEILLLISSDTKEMQAAQISSFLEADSSQFIHIRQALEATR